MGSPMTFDRPRGPLRETLRFTRPGVGPPCRPPAGTAQGAGHGARPAPCAVREVPRGQTTAVARVSPSNGVGTARATSAWWLAAVIAARDATAAK